MTKIVFVNPQDRSFVLLNPELVDRRDEKFEVWDVCFSANASFVARIERDSRIVVKYLGEDGARRREDFEDYFSELLQHEIDHLHGRLFIDLIENPETITMLDEWGGGEWVLCS